MSKKPVSELEGAELDYWVAKAKGYKIEHGETWALKYSTEWNHGMPIVERERIAIKPIIQSGEMWIAGEHGTTDSLFFSAMHPLVAAMRYFVYSKFGEYVGGE